MDMQELRDIRDREWAIHRRQLDAWRTWKLIDADRQREAEHTRKLAQDLEVTAAALSEARAALVATNAELAKAEAALGATKAALTHAQAVGRKKPRWTSC